MWPQVFPLAQTGMLLQISLRHQPEELGLFVLIFQESRIHTAKIRGDAGRLHSSANGHKGAVASSSRPRLVPHNLSPYPGKCSWKVSELRSLLKAGRIHGQDSQN